MLFRSAGFITIGNSWDSGTDTDGKCKLTAHCVPLLPLTNTTYSSNENNCTSLDRTPWMDEQQ